MKRNKMDVGYCLMAKMKPHRKGEMKVFSFVAWKETNRKVMTFAVNNPVLRTNQ